MKRKSSKKKEIDKLVASFVASIPQDTIDEIYREGPSSAYSKCYRWASSTVNGWPDLKLRWFLGKGPKGIVSSVSAWGELANLAYDALVSVHGEVPTPELPATPDDLEVVLTYSTWPEGIDCPAKRPRKARTVAFEATFTGPGLSWPTEHYLSTNRTRTHWFLWAEGDPGDYHEEHRAVPIAYCKRDGVPAKDAAIFMLRAWWRLGAEEYDQDRPQEKQQREILSHDELSVLEDEVWDPVEERREAEEREREERREAELARMARRNEELRQRAATTATDEERKKREQISKRISATLDRLEKLPNCTVHRKATGKAWILPAQRPRKLDS